MKKALQLFYFLLIALFALPFALLPYPVSMKTGEVLGGLLYYLWKSRRKIALDNIRAAVSRGAIRLQTTPEAAIKQNFRNLGKSFAEVVRIYYGLGGRIFNHVQIIGAERLYKALDKGGGAILVTGHCGNWELVALVSSMKVARLNVVARAQNNIFLHRFVEKTREKYGNSVIYKKGALKNIIRVLKQNEVVGILMDQSVVSSEAVVADFLGKKDHILKIPAIIARKTGAPVLPAFIRRTETGHLIEIGEEIELDKAEDYDQAVYNDTIRFSSHIENYIKNNPTEWLWIHRRWKRIKDYQ